jgi:hypothetical protein
MMAIPVLKCQIFFSSGVSFAPPIILDFNALDTNVFGTSAGVTVDVSTLIDRITTQRGRNAVADQFQAGTMTLRLIDQNGNFNPQNAAGPYYGLLNPMVKVALGATYLGVYYPIFSGYITTYDYVTPDNISSTVGYTVIQAIDAFRLLNLASITTVAGAVAGETTSVRVGRILDQISWPASMRTLSTGNTTVQADTGTVRTALNACQNLESTEYGAFYADKLGNLVFKSRTNCATSVAGTPTVFTDQGGDITFADAVWKLDDTLIYNQANVTRNGGALQTASNAASITQYFLHTFNESGLMMQTDAEALNNALAYVASRATTTTRCDLLVLNLYTPSYSAGTVAALDLDYLDPVTITNGQPGGTTLSKTEQIFGISHSITPGNWIVSFTTLEPIIDAFILNSSLSGVLDTSTLSY